MDEPNRLQNPEAPAQRSLSSDLILKCAEETLGMVETAQGRAGLLKDKNAFYSQASVYLEQARAMVLEGTDKYRQQLKQSPGPV